MEVQALINGESTGMKGILPLLRSTVPSFDPTVVFDVGSNVGQSLSEIRELFPKATVHCFEPAPSTFANLSEQFGNVEQVRLHRIALSDHNGTGHVMDYPLGT